ncbi:MAG TPA: hypothetical protein VHM19_23340 [Polyangiales bacterium]|jgi:hypothetical protein|nr:hypothetical protein [Polyangiales bacterium]
MGRPTEEQLAWIRDFAVEYATDAFGPCREEKLARVLLHLLRERELLREYYDAQTSDNPRRHWGEVEHDIRAFDRGDESMPAHADAHSVGGQKG